MNTNTNTNTNINTNPNMNIRKEIEEEKIQKRLENYKTKMKQEEDAREKEYLANKLKWDFPDDGMSYFDFMCLKNAISEYEKLRPITKSIEYKQRHGLSL